MGYKLIYLGLYLAYLLLTLMTLAAPRKSLIIRGLQRFFYNRIAENSKH